MEHLNQLPLPFCIESTKHLCPLSDILVSKDTPGLYCGNSESSRKLEAIERCFSVRPLAKPACPHFISPHLSDILLLGYLKFFCCSNCAKITLFYQSYFYVVVLHSIKMTIGLKYITRMLIRHLKL